MHEFESPDWELGPQDHLFEIGPDWRMHSVQHSTTSGGLPYAYGFHQAGDELVSRAIDRGRVHDHLAFPTLYLYRHAIELSLKSVIYIGENVSSVNGHDLRKLWDRALPVVYAAGGKDDPVVEHVCRIIGELADVDENAEQFRYDRDRKGLRRELPETLMRVDVVHVQKIVARVMSFLDAVVDTIDAYRQDMPDH